MTLESEQRAGAVGCSKVRCIGRFRLEKSGVSLGPTGVRVDQVPGFEGRIVERREEVFGPPRERLALCDVLPRWIYRRPFRLPSSGALFAPVDRDAMWLRVLFGRSLEHDFDAQTFVFINRGRFGCEGTDVEKTFVVVAEQLVARLPIDFAASLVTIAQQADDEIARYAARIVLARFSDAPELEALVERLERGSAKNRRLLERASAWPDLLLAIRTGDDDRRIAAVRDLLRHRDHDIVAAIDVHPLPDAVARDVLDALASTRDSSHEPTVLRYLDSDWSVAEAAVEALASVGTAACRPALRRALSRPDVPKAVVREIEALLAIFEPAGEQGGALSIAGAGALSEP